MKFNYDMQKSENNKAKHGIDFEEAALAWDDENMIILRSPYLEESRFLALGHIYNLDRYIHPAQRRNPYYFRPSRPR